MKREPSLGADCAINVDKLVESKLLVQANSGAGKSWAIRRIIEQTYGKTQQIVIDHDGEYHTLREKFDFVLAGQKGDCPADIKSAALLARRLLELNVSAIIDIYELGTQRAEFVKRFLDSLVNAPRDLWHSCLVILDEAHLYCPEKGSAVSADAVKNLMALGRKRGFSGVLATQRIAKLDKDAAAECNSKLIGRSALDVDMKRAADELGFTSREDTRSLRTLKAGQFYAFGPAFTDEVKLVQVGGVQTTHLRAGQRAAPSTPPRDKVKKILAQLADLPHEAEQEAKTVSELQLQVKQLRGELKKAVAAQPEPVEKIIEKPVITDKQIVRLEHLLHKADAFGSKTIDALHVLGAELNAFKNVWLPAMKSPLKLTPSNGVRPIDPTIRAAAQAVRDRARSVPEEKSWSKGDPLHHAYVSHPPDSELPQGEQAILRALIQFPDGLRREQLSVLTSYKTSTRNAYIARLTAKGFVDANLVLVFATDAGRAALPNAAPLPTGEALRDFWYRELPDGECAVLKELVRVYPDTASRSSISDETGYKTSTRNAYLSRLRAKQLIVEVNREDVRANQTLFEVDA
jgi:hypothetical protein